MKGATMNRKSAGISKRYPFSFVRTLLHRTLNQRVFHRPAHRISYITLLQQFNLQPQQRLANAILFLLHVTLLNQVARKFRDCAAILSFDFFVFGQIGKQGVERLFSGQKLFQFARGVFFTQTFGKFFPSPTSIFKGLSPCAQLRFQPLNSTLHSILMSLGSNFIDNCLSHNKNAENRSVKMPS